MYLSVGITGSGQSDGDQGHPRNQVAKVEEHHTSRTRKGMNIRGENTILTKNV